MSRFRRTLALSLLLTALALPASAVTSARTNESSGGFFSALWNVITSLVSTDGRCGADPWGICTGGDSTDQRATVDPWG